MSYGAKVARTIMIGGLSVSVGGNLVHSFLLPTHDAISVVGSALPPTFLLGCVEVLLSLKWQKGWASDAVRWVLLPAIAVLSFYLSWLHIDAVILSWGADKWEARTYPVMIDAAMLLAGAALVLEGTEPDPGPDQAGEGAGSVEQADRTGPDPQPDPQPDQAGSDRTRPTGPPTGLPDQADRTTGPDQADRTGPPDRTPTGPPSRPRLVPAPNGKPSRVDVLMPRAREFELKTPGIGWKAIADAFRAEQVQCGSETARELRARLTAENDEKTGKEVVNG